MTPNTVFALLGLFLCGEYTFYCILKKRGVVVHLLFMFIIALMFGLAMIIVAATL